MESLTTFLLAANGKVKIKYSDIKNMIMRVLEQNPEELNKLKEENPDEQSVLGLFEKHGMAACCKIVF